MANPLDSGSVPERQDSLAERAVKAAIQHYQQHRAFWPAYESGKDVLYAEAGISFGPDEIDAILLALRLEAMDPAEGDLRDGWFHERSQSYITGNTSDDLRWGEAYFLYTTDGTTEWRWRIRDHSQTYLEGVAPSAAEAIDAADRALATAREEAGNA